MTMITFAQAQVRIGPGLIAAAASGAFLALPLSGKVACHRYHQSEITKLDF